MQVTRIAALKKLMSERIELMLSNIRLRRTAGLEAVAGRVARGPSKLEMDRIESLAGQIEADEQRLLQAGTARAEATARAALLALAFGGALLFLFLGLIWALIRLDLLKRGEAEEEVRRTAAELRTTLRSIGDAVLATDARGRVILMNPVAEELTGWREDEALGRDSREIFRIINELTRKPGRTWSPGSSAKDGSSRWPTT